MTVALVLLLLAALLLLGMPIGFAMGLTGVVGIYAVGGLDTLMIGRTLYDEFFVNRDWPLASAVAIMLLVLLVVPIVVLQKNQARDEEQAA